MAAPLGARFAGVFASAVCGDGADLGHVSTAPDGIRATRASLLEQQAGRLALRAMPVMVTGADTSAGLATVRALRALEGEIRAFVPPQAFNVVDALRSLGCKVAQGDLDDEGRLELALEQVHTVVHLAGSLLDPPATMLDELATVVGAGIGAGCRRIIWASWLGADDPGADEVLQACAEGEALLADAPLESIVIRRAVTYGRGEVLSERLADGVPPQLHAVLHAPLYVDDLAAAVTAADRHRYDTSVPQIVVELAGPEDCSLGEFSRRLGAGVRKVGRTAMTPLPGWVVAYLSTPRPPGPDALGREGTSLAEGLRQLRRTA